MNVMLYRSGKGTRVWGKQYKTIIVDESSVQEKISEGWHKHPDEVVSEDIQQEKLKRTRKTKAESDEDNNEG